MQKPPKIILTLLAATIIILCTAASCKNGKKNQTTTDSKPTVQAVNTPDFSADSAFAFCEAQCAFGPRTMNSKAHDDCERWIISQFEKYGCEVTTQKVVLRGYDATPLQSTNIIASAGTDKKRRILICAHWDSRPWADNDPDSTNWKKPVLAANDGASGVAVMLETARLLQNDTTVKVGVDFVCFDAEDWGIPQWIGLSREDSWALGAQYWASNYKRTEGKETLYGILLDMVGGEEAVFYQELNSKKYAPAIVNKVWAAARAAGYSNYFPTQHGGMITDDHVPVNQKAGIPTIDIIPFYPDCEQGSFGPVWHTVHDDMNHIDRNTLKAVGQTILQVVYSEQ